MAENNVTAEILRQRISYDPESGAFRLKVGYDAGRVIGSLTDRGYVNLSTQRSRHRAHRVAWLLSYGEWPSGEIDHINRVRSDNRLVNLRDVPRNINRQNEHGPHANNTTGVRGVSRSSTPGKFVAYIGANGKQTYLGSFDTADAAGEAYEIARQRLHPGRPMTA